MVNIKSKLSSRGLIRSGLLMGMLAILGVPSVASATDDDNPDCEESVLALEIDTFTGEVFVLNSATGQPVLSDNDITLHLGSLSRVLVDVQLSDGEWQVDVTPDGEATEQHLTRGGAMRYVVEEGSDYVFEFAPIGQTNMVPIPPIVIRPDPPCPPED